MSRTYVRQEQSYKSVAYDDGLAAGVALQDSSTDLEYDLNAIRSQVKRYAGEAQWYTDKGGRDLKTTASDLLDLEGKKLLFRSQILTDITVPAVAKATGTINCVSKAEHVNAEKVSINDGTRTVNYWFDVSGAYEPPGGYNATNIEVDISGATDADSVKVLLVSAINGSTIDITASSGGSGIVDLDHDINGAWNYAITHNVADVDFTVVGMEDGTGNVVVLVEADDEDPTEAAAVDAGTYAGALVKVLTGNFGAHSMAEIGGANAINPKNLMVVRDSTSAEVILSGGKVIWALLQAEPGVIDADAFNDVDHRIQLSFVKENATGDDLVVVPAADIAGKTLNYSYVLRVALDNVPEQAFLTGAFVDQAGAVDVNLQNAIDNQGSAVVENNNITIKLTDTKYWQWQDSTGTDTLLKILADAGGDAVSMKVKSFNIENTDPVDLTGGITVDSDGTDIQIGVAAGTLESLGKLDIKTAAASDLSLLAGRDIIFQDDNWAGSTYDTALVLSASSTEWTNFDTAFGEASLLSAIYQAYSKAKFDKKVARVTNGQNANVNMSGTTAPVYLDATLLDCDGKTFVDDVNVFLNGVLLRNGADADANHDVYPGTDPTYGDIMFEFKTKTGDQITMEVF